MAGPAHGPPVPGATRSGWPEHGPPAPGATLTGPPAHGRPGRGAPVHGRHAHGRPAPGAHAHGRHAPGRPAPGAPAHGRHAPGRTTPGRHGHGRPGPGQTTPGRWIRSRFSSCRDEVSLGRGPPRGLLPGTVGEVVALVLTLGGLSVLMYRRLGGRYSMTTPGGPLRLLRPDGWYVRCGILRLLAAAGELISVRIWRGSTSEDLTFLEAVLVAAVLTMPPLLTIAVVLTGLVAASIIQRRDWSKTLFNVGSYATSMAAMIFIYYTIVRAQTGSLEIRARTPRCDRRLLADQHLPAFPGLLRRRRLQSTPVRRRNGDCRARWPWAVSGSAWPRYSSPPNARLPSCPSSRSGAGHVVCVRRGSPARRGRRAEQVAGQARRAACRARPGNDTLENRQKPSGRSCGAPEMINWSPARRPTTFARNSILSSYLGRSGALGCSTPRSSPMGGRPGS